MNKSPHNLLTSGVTVLLSKLRLQGREITPVTVLTHSLLWHQQRPFLVHMKVLQLASCAASVRQSEKSVSHMPRDLSGDAAHLFIYFLTVAVSYSYCLPLPMVAAHWLEKFFELLESFMLLQHLWCSLCLSNK